MSNIDKQALREAAEKATPGRIGDRIDGSVLWSTKTGHRVRVFPVSVF